MKFMGVHESKIDIEVVYALPENQFMRQISVPPGTTARQAVELSAIIDLYPEIDLACNKLGIFGRRVNQGTVLCNGDRVEIYRPLKVDPKENRRRRAKEFKSIRKPEA
jgi:putative ubiquitin-RnfH superfamily antitoxin RatB of RatAB toxin-antitoxin module